jgi:hypothetical protein
MKTNKKFFAIILALVISSLIFQKQASAQQNNVSFQVFYDELSPYGQWVDFSNYGYVWIPDAGPDFVPYSTEGHWILTNYGWTWVSYYNWGWAPFHYGRWDYDNYYGWFWVPDNEWGPSWVNWRRADGYYGWRPMQPGFNTGFGRDYNSYNDHWIFIRDRDIARYNINRYYVNRNDYDWAFSNSTVINNTYIDRNRNTTYVSGPARADVQRVIGRRVRPVTIQEKNGPGQDISNGQLRIYRPQVKMNSDMEKKPAPNRIADLNEVKRPSERNATIRQQKTDPYYKGSEHQPDIMNPQNRNNNALPLKPQNVNPNSNNSQEPQTDIVNTQNRNNNAQPSKPQNVSPYDNNSQEIQPDIMNPQNRNNNAQHLKSQNVNPSDNNRRERLQNTENQQNSNSVTSPPAQPRNVTHPIITDGNGNQIW